MSDKEQKKGIRHLLDDIDDSISWLEISNKYFGRSASWMYQKLGGYSSNGGFTAEELELFRSALLDLSMRIKVVAESLPKISDTSED